MPCLMMPRAAVDNGATLFDAGVFYNMPDDSMANIKLVRAFLDAYPEYESKIILAVKGGRDPRTFQSTSKLMNRQGKIKQ